MVPDLFFVLLFSQAILFCLIVLAAIPLAYLISKWQIAKGQRARMRIADYVRASPEKIVSKNLYVDIIIPRRNRRDLALSWRDSMLLAVEEGWLLVSAEWDGQREGILLYRKRNNKALAKLCILRGRVLTVVLDENDVRVPAHFWPGRSWLVGLARAHELNFINAGPSLVDVFSEGWED